MKQSNSDGIKILICLNSQCMMSFQPSSSDDSGSSGFSALQDMYLPASRTDGTYWITDSVTFPSGLV